MTVDTDAIASNTTPQEKSASSSVHRPAGLALVVGHTGHAASTAALNAAIDLAQRLDAHLHVVHSVTFDDYGIDPDIDAYERACERNLAQERETIAATLAGTVLRWTYHEERGDPATRLARLAVTVDASFIIVGATSPGMLHHLIGGSVPKRLLHNQRRTIVVVPPDPATARTVAS